MPKAMVTTKDNKITADIKPNLTADMILESNRYKTKSPEIIRCKQLVNSEGFIL